MNGEKTIPEIGRTNEPEMPAFSCWVFFLLRELNISCIAASSIVL